MRLNLSAAVCLVLVSVVRASGQPAAPAEELFKVLATTGAERDGLREVAAHPNPGPYLDALLTGYSGRIIRLYALAQRFSHPDRPTQPAYLVLTGTQGGFPRKGFHDGAPRPDVYWVDLHRDGQVSGRYGAMDQIFPHELLHIIVGDLAGEMPVSNATQVHAVGVRTDRVTAFNEGFAEHAQIMAIEDPDAPAATRALAADVALRDRAFGRTTDYERALAARWRVAPKPLMTFPLWFSGSEQVLRYHAVRDNLFAREADIPARMYTASRAYDAYRLEHVLPGTPDAPPKPLSRLVATEGVVSAFFYRLVNHEALRRGDRDEAFYARFGVTRAEIDDLDNAYLKIFAAIREGGFDTAAVADAYKRLFPEEAAAVDEVWRSTFGPGTLPAEIWLLNPDFLTGTSLFDQFRGSPRAYAFDLNAASMTDLVAVPGVEAALASAILEAAPFTSLDDLSAVPGMTPDVLARFTRMADVMRDPASAGIEAEGQLSITGILVPYVWRALGFWALCAVAGALCYRAVRRARWWRLAFVGLGAALVALVAGWFSSVAVALAAPVVIFGLPGTLVSLWRTRSVSTALRVPLAWLCATLPAVLAVTPIG